MSTTYPGAVQTFTDPSGTSLLATGPDHASLHTNINDTVEALQNTIGTTGGTNVLKNFSSGQFPVRTNSGGTLVQTITGGTINSSAMGTPSITGGTINSSTLGTPAITGGTAASITLTLPSVTNGAISFNSQRGLLINGKIVPSVSSDNLTVAIKGLDGNDPSASNPVYCRIGDTVRTISTALSVTKNAGTNWMNLGATEHATLERDLFVYLGYNATDGVVVGFSRISYATEYDDFSATSTNDKYAAISTITSATAGDDYELIGRFAATLSAGAGYTWTVPAFTNKNLIQRPIYQTRWLAYTPTYTGFSADPTIGSRFSIVGNICYVIGKSSANGTSNATGFTISLPIVSSASCNVFTSGIVGIDSGAYTVTTVTIGNSVSAMTLYKGTGDGTNFTNSGNKSASPIVFYEI